MCYDCKLYATLHAFYAILNSKLGVHKAEENMGHIIRNHADAPPNQTITVFTNLRYFCPSVSVKCPFLLSPDLAQEKLTSDALAVTLKDKTDALAVALSFFFPVQQATSGSPCVACCRVASRAVAPSGKLVTICSSVAAPAAAPAYPKIKIKCCWLVYMVYLLDYNSYKR